MNNSKKGLIAAAAVIAVLLVIGGTYLYQKNKDDSVVPQPEIGTEFISKCGFTIDSPSADAAVSFPVTITGTIDNTEAETTGCSWIMSEGQAGLATLHYETKEGWSLPVDSKPVMVENWMSLTSPFTVTLNFDNSKEQLPAGYNFKVIFTEENPSGEGTPDTAELPLTLK